MAGSAAYFDGKVATGRPANVHFSDNELVIVCTDGLEIRWQLSNLRYVDPPIDGQPARLRNLYEHPDRLTLADDFDLAALKSRCPDLAKGHTGWSRNWRRIVLWSGAAVFSVIFMIGVAIPMIAHEIALNLPKTLEMRLGAQAKEQIITALSIRQPTSSNKSMVCKGGGLDDLDQLISTLYNEWDVDQKINVEVINLDIENAFALPGGNILVFDGLLRNLKHPNELAGILAHETAHIHYRHPTEIFLKEIGTFALLGLVFGDVTGASVMAGLGKILIGTAYSREAERTSDEFGVAVMNEADFDARPLAEFLLRLDAKLGDLENIFSFVLTHPGSKSRATWVMKHSTGTQPALSADAWRKVRNICQ